MGKFASLIKQISKWLIPMSWRFGINAFFSKKCSMGRDVFVHPSVQMLGAGNVAIGSFSCISEHTWLNVNHRNKGEIAIQIDANCFIGRRNFFSSGKKIEIGAYTLTTIDCKFICSGHVVDDPLVPYLASGTTSDGIIRIGANCVFGAGSMVLGNIVIGHGSVIGACALVTKNVPPFSMVIGNPARILRRYSFAKKTWIDAELLADNDLVDNPDEATYLNLLMNDYPKLSMPLIAAGSDYGNL
jgi:acetyltransferase-like isoleucine patch superfamily enzyme